MKSGLRKCDSPSLNQLIRDLSHVWNSEGLDNPELDSRSGLSETQFIYASLGFGSDPHSFRPQTLSPGPGLGLVLDSGCGLALGPGLFVGSFGLFMYELCFSQVGTCGLMWIHSGNQIKDWNRQGAMKTRSS